MIDRFNARLRWLKTIQPDFGSKPRNAGSWQAKAQSSLDKEAWLRLAEDWLKLAVSKEEGQRQ
jgi:hypothetical protein